MDLLASEYGWSKREILEGTYLDEVVYLLPKIRERHVTEWQMQLAIVQNPHVKNPRDLWESLAETVRTPVDEKLDKEALLRLKTTLAGNSKAIAVR